MTNYNEILDDVLSAVYLAGTENGLSRRITDPEEIMRRKEAFIKGNRVSDEAKQALLDWHNKQVEAVLDRLEGQSRRADDCTDDTLVVKMVRVEAERNKLKENTNE